MSLKVFNVLLCLCIVANVIVGQGTNRNNNNRNQNDDVVSLRTDNINQNNNNESIRPNISQRQRQRRPTPVEGQSVNSDSVSSHGLPNVQDFDYGDDYVPYQGDSQDTFDWLLTRAMMVKDNTNMFISPFSVKLLLVLLSEASGTDTQTQKELSIILSNIRAPYTARNLYGRIFDSLLEPSDDYEFKIGTKIFVDQFIEPLQRYAAIIERYYKTDIEQYDFKQVKPTTDSINGWCSNITNGHINNLVQQSDVDRSVMIMLNAIYFHGLWRRPFPTNETQELPFYISSTQQLKTTFMSQTGHYYYFESPQLNSKILRIPYKGRKFSMLVVLPNSKEGLSELVRELDGNSLRRIEWLMDELEVRVVFPKFKFEHLSNVNDVLKELGIQQIFTAEASLPLLARGAGLQHQLQVSNIIQKAGIQIDERGSTAYAATEVSLVNKFGEGTKEFIANRPFAFFIQDETTGTLLFAGKVTNPADYEVPA